MRLHRLHTVMRDYLWQFSAFFISILLLFLSKKSRKASVFLVLLEVINLAIKSGDPGFFLSSEWEIPQNTDVNTMHEIMKIIHAE